MHNAQYGVTGVGHFVTMHVLNAGSSVYGLCVTSFLQREYITQVSDTYVALWAKVLD